MISRSLPRLPRRAPWLLAALLLAALAPPGCMKKTVPPGTPMTLTIPSRVNVVTVDLAGVYDVMANYMGTQGLKRNKDASNSKRGLWTSDPVRCQPSGDERNVAMCTFSVQVDPGAGGVASTIVNLHVRVGDHMRYDPNLLREQITIESVMDRVVTELRSRYQQADVLATDPLQF